MNPMGIAHLPNHLSRMCRESAIEDVPTEAETAAVEVEPQPEGCGVRSG